MNPTLGDRCFVDELLEPARFLDIIRVSGDASNQSAVRSQSFSNLESLRTYVENDENDDYSCRFISICQRNSWRPLQITRPMMSLIVNAHDLSHSFWDLPSCFYTRSLDLEEAYCIPFTLIHGRFVSYTIRYPEFKESDEEWAIRQSGIFHRFNTETRQSVFLLLSPKPDSKGHRLVEECLLSWHQGGANTGPLSLHEALFSVYLPSWRQYLATHEGEFLPMANSTFATYIDEPLRLGYDHLSAMISLETRFVKATSLLASTMDVLKELTTLLSYDPGLLATSEESDQVAIKLNNRLRQCAAHSRTATYRP
ncbi:hypothetical protein TOPH_02807 [Tolypocladium ophioglossoides CBS 100239]|uniref:CorA-like transporter domain-containing protein n=1 Tax=Tolypocladium ophioglossoides (strain CBS 100239) TaxID=1163406 RepID=A0A0L0NFF8_TOLOC|nr:hypothetical protein TOPH_02807 [Tolypocladium ophioglossoides CBS 100239]